MVEHDYDIIKNSDYILDLGPGAGEQGGQVMYFGPTGGLNGSLTGQYLTGERQIPVPDKRRTPKRAHWLTIEGAAEHNLKGIQVRIPLGLFVCLTGVSGSGKSTLADEILLQGRQMGQGRPAGTTRHVIKGIKGLDIISDAVLVDQRPIGRTPRANPLTYTKAMDPIRHLLAETPEADARGLGAGPFFV